jgi:MFS transporter, DHA1 family, staphyloferrin B biosynthesis exporter
MLAVAMFLVSFAWSSVFVGLPFYVERITRAEPATTIAWTGWILGISSLVSMVASPLWARYAAHADARTACVLLQVLQGIGFLGAAFADSPLELFVARLLLGAVGATSTLLFLLAGDVPDSAERRRKLSVIQSANTAGQIVAPLAGAVAFARLGFRLSFALGALVLVISGALLQWGLPPARPAGLATTARRRRPVPVRLVVLTSTVALVGASQEAFLAAILPRVLPGFGVRPEGLVESAGLLIFLSGVAAAAGSLAAPRLAAEVPPRRLLPALLAASSVLLIAFSLAGSLWLYAGLRTVQALCLAPLFPLVVARMSRHGEAIGMLSAARSGGNFLGPVLATSLLAWGPPWTVYLLLGLAGLAAVPWTRR